MESVCATAELEDVALLKIVFVSAEISASVTVNIVECASIRGSTSQHTIVRHNLFFRCVLGNNITFSLSCGDVNLWYHVVTCIYGIIRLRAFMVSCGDVHMVECGGAVF